MSSSDLAELDPTEEELEKLDALGVTGLDALVGMIRAVPNEAAKALGEDLVQRALALRPNAPAAGEAPQFKLGAKFPKSENDSSAR